jgi:integrase
MIIPPRLRSILGKRELKQSLGTEIRAEAIFKAHQCHIDAHNLFQRTEKRMATPRKQSAKEMHLEPLNRLEEGCLKKITLTIGGQKVVIEHEDPVIELETASKLLSLSPSTAAPIKTPPAIKDTSISLAKMVRAYFAEIRLTDSQTPKTQEENAAIFQLLGEVLRNPSASTIGFKLANDFKTAIMQLPPNRTKGFYAGKSVSEILRSHPNVTMSIANVNKYLRRCSALFEWARKHGHVVENPFSGMAIRQSKTKANEQRERFTIEDIQKLFDPEFLHRRMRKSYMFWLPWLGLYTGARLEELSQLHLEDVRQEAGIWVFDINEKLEKRLKTASSRRLIPIHPMLEAVGLLEHVKALQKRGETRLFPELEHRRDGYGQTVSKWFARYRKARGVGKTYHSFRHTVIDELKQKGCDYKIVAALAGHTDESMTFGTYGSDYNVEIMRELVMKLSFPISAKC